MKKILLLFAGFVFFAGCLHAQTDFRPGYVITNAGDTLRGEIDYRGDRLMGEICKFRSADGKIVKYTPYDIAAYRFVDSKYYVAREIPDKMAFLEFLIKGQVNIYYLREDDGDERYFIDKEGEPLSEIPYEEGIREVDNKLYFYQTTEHQKVLSRYMQDAPQIQKQISELDRPDHDNLIALAKDYSNAVCKGGQCVVYAKNLRAIGIALDGVGGAIFYYNGVSSFTGGVLVNIWSPRINEKLYFRTGLLVSRYKYRDDYWDGQSGMIVNVPRWRKESIYKIPLMLEYIYPKSTIIKPKAAFGWSAYYPADLSLTCMAGVNIQLGGRASLSVEYNIDFVPHAFPIIPKEFFSQAVLGGLHFQF